MNAFLGLLDTDTLVKVRRRQALTTCAYNSGQQGVINDRLVIAATLPRAVVGGE